MQVSGQHQFNISVQQLWDYLMDSQVLAKITPGVTQLKTLSPDEYQSISDIKIGPVKGSFKGKLAVVDKQAPLSFTIKMEQMSKIGNAHVNVNMLLNEVDAEKSQLTFDGKAKLSGVIARTGQRVLSGVANTLTKEVFAALEQHIEEEKTAQQTSENKEEQHLSGEQKRLDEPQTIETQNTQTTQEHLMNVESIETVPEESLETSSNNYSPITQKSEEITNSSINLFTRILNFIKQIFSIK